MQETSLSSAVEVGLTELGPADSSAMDRVKDTTEKLGLQLHHPFDACRDIHREVDNRVLSAVRTAVLPEGRRSRCRRVPAGQSKMAVRSDELVCKHAHK